MNGVQNASKAWHKSKDIKCVDEIGWKHDHYFYLPVVTYYLNTGAKIENKAEIISQKKTKIPPEDSFVTLVRDGPDQPFKKM